MFHFSLENVLRHRKKEEQIKIKELSEVLQKELSIKNQMDNIHTRIQIENEKITQQKRLGNFSLNIWQLDTMFRKKTEHDLSVLQQQLHEISQTVEAKRVLVMEAAKARRVLEILKEREENQYKQELLKQERIHLDEMSTNHFRFLKN